MKKPKREEFFKVFFFFSFGNENLQESFRRERVRESRVPESERERLRV